MIVPVVILALAIAPQAPGAGARDTLPADAYLDPGVRALIERAREVRDRTAGGIESYAATLKERLYVGLSAFRWRRERALFQQERAARVWWSADSAAVVKWLGARRRLPVVGAAGEARVTREGDTARAEIRVGPGHRRGEARLDPMEALRHELEKEVPPLPLDPGGERLFFWSTGRSWALHPLADTAAYHYRFRSGDTLRIRLPTRERPVALIEAVVEPRQARFNLLAGSLWFDAESARLVRATVRPARAFDLELDEPEDARDVPGFLKPLQVRFDYITVDYSFQEMRWWLPRRMAIRGEMRAGKILAVPVTFEWLLTDYLVNEASANPDPGPALPAGWSRNTVTRRRGDEETERRYTVLVPPAESLAVAAALPQEPFAREPLAFDARELVELRERLARVPVPALRAPPRLSWGPGAGLLRYNRVEGLALGAKLAVPLDAQTTLSVSALLGTADVEPNGELRLTRSGADRTLALAAYRDLAWVGDWERPLSLPNSLSALILGSDYGHYYRVAGVKLEGQESAGFLRSGWRLFAERHNSAAKHSDFSFAKLVGAAPDSGFADNLPIEPGAVAGAGAELRVQSAVDPSRPLASALVWGEAALGDFDYRRTAASVAVTSPLAWKLAGALELGAGTSWGHLPGQRHYGLGGSRTLRGFRSLALRGPAFWMARAELANDLPAARVALFYDAAWAGPRSRFGVHGYAASAGIGLSLLDGILRVDVAHPVRGGAGWRVHVYGDALF